MVKHGSEKNKAPENRGLLRRGGRDSKTQEAMPVDGGFSRFLDGDQTILPCPPMASNSVDCGLSPDPCTNCTKTCLEAVNRALEALDAGREDDVRRTLTAIRTHLGPFPARRAQKGLTSDNK